MIKRTIEISREPAHLALRSDQLVISPRGREQRQPTSVPCEDLGMLLVDHPAVTYSHAALSGIVEFGGVLVVCGRDHLPAGVIINFEIMKLKEVIKSHFCQPARGDTDFDVLDLGYFKKMQSKPNSFVSMMQNSR